MPLRGWFGQGRPALEPSNGVAGSPGPRGAITRSWPLCDLNSVEYTYVESIWPNVPLDRMGSFQLIQSLGERLVAETGFGYAGVVRDDKGRALTPSALDAGGFVTDPERRQMWLTASVAHGALDRPVAFDFGARKHPPFWTDEPTCRLKHGLLQPPKHLLSGSANATALTMLKIGGGIESLDTSPDGGRLALLEHWGHSNRTHWCVSIVEAETGVRRLLTTGIGHGQIRFSPDGQWLLIGSTLVEADTGKHVSLPVPLGARWEVSWCPAWSPSTLLVVESRLGERPDLAAFDLTTQQLDRLGPLEFPSDYSTALKDFDISADGRFGLCGTQSRPPGGSEWGVDYRLSLLDVEARRIERLADPFADSEQVFERMHGGFRWLRRPSPTSEIVLAPELVAQLGEPIQGLDEENYAWVAGHARDLAHAGLDAMLGEDASASDPHGVGSEVLRALEAVKDFQPDGDWMHELTSRFDTTLQMIEASRYHGVFSADVQDGWQRFADRWSTIRDAPAGPPRISRR